MQTENRLFDDLAKVAGGALNTLSGLRDEVENRVRERVERLLAEMDFVSREEFEAVQAMAAKARSEQEDLAARLAKLEAEVDALRSTASAAKRAAAKPPARPRQTKAKPQPQQG